MPEILQNNSTLTELHICYSFFFPIFIGILFLKRRMFQMNVELGILEEKVRLVNELAHPRWDSIGQIMRSNFRTRLVNGRLEVRPYARCVDLDVPAGCSTVALDDAQNGFDVWDQNLGEWVCHEAQANAGGKKAPESGPGLQAVGKMTIQRKSHLAEKNGDPLRKWPALWPLTRRFLTETRDRMAPYVRR